MEERNENRPITFEVATKDAHFKQILELQKQNHYTTISEAQQLTEGFVFAAHDMRILKLMAANAPQIIALSGDKVVGYNLGMTCEMEQELPSLIPMFQEFRNWTYQGKPLMDYQFIVGGQVCVHKDFRGRGLIRQLYQQTREVTAGQYQLCVTEISVRNTTSLKAHQKLGFEILGVYNDGVEDWNLVVWKYEVAKPYF